jgi:hypothetical protein
MYIHLNHKDSRLKYPENRPLDFISDLGQTINIGNARCALTDLSFVDTRRNKEDIYILCDICDVSFVCGMYLPLLRIVGESATLDCPFYLPTSFKQINSIRVYAKQINSDGQLVESSFQPDSFRCTLHIDCLE